MAYIDQQNLSRDSVFRQRVQVAMQNAAISIQSEATATVNHTNRSNYAKLVLNAPEAYAIVFASAITANDLTLTLAALDATIQNDVNAIWNAMAGVI